MFRPGNAQMSTVYSGCTDNFKLKRQDVKNIRFWKAKRFSFALL